MTDGQLYIRPGADARIVGPETPTNALAEALNDPTLHVAFRDDVLDSPSSARLYTRAMMAAIDIDFPVLVLHVDLEQQWIRDNAQNHLDRPRYDGELPAPQRVTAFGIVTPHGRG